MTEKKWFNKKGLSRRVFIKRAAVGVAVGVAATYGVTTLIKKSSPTSTIENELAISDLELVSKIELRKEDSLIIVDMQNDFLPNGALSVIGGDEIISPINSLAKRFRNHGNSIVMTQDWHPPGHLSFASSHNKNPFEPFESEGIGPVLWPDHCVQGSRGAEFHPDIEERFANAIIRKGFHPNVDSYSTFIENDMKTYTGLSGLLNTLGIKRAFLCGLALDYCVYYSAIDGRNLGFDVVVPIDLSKAIDSPPGHLSNALQKMIDEGVQFVKSDNIV
ncbi:bifunctional nicotinamidase/pyrazinamidase [[Eubacterium] cellulosolvens]